PAAYMRSSTSTVRGKKSIPSRMPRAALAVTSTSVLPRRATTAPWLWNASFPVSKLSERSVPDKGFDTMTGSAISLVLLPGGSSAGSGSGASSQSALSASGGERRLAADLHAAVVLLVVNPAAGPSGGGWMRQERPEGRSCRRSGQRRRPFLAMIRR